jgi:uncharacterized protein (TIGR03118 family)
MCYQTSQKSGFKFRSRHLCLLGLAALFALPVMSAVAKGKAPPTPGQSKQTYLVSDVPDTSVLQDTNLVNAWGISCSATSPFWISATGTGMAEVYSVTNDALGTPSVTSVGLEVAIPGNGTVTGQVCNNTPSFNGDLFIFASEDGTISGWRGDLGIAAEVLTTRNGAFYTGITLAPLTTTSTNGPVLLAANFSEGKVDVYDGNMNLVGQYADTNAPAGYAPFNVQLAGGKIYVTFAKQDAAKQNPVTGAGYGLIDVFNPTTHTFSRFVTGSNISGRFSTINAPWGVALAPASYGTHANQLLVANYGSGTIMAFSTSGSYSGLLGLSGKSPYVINGIHGLVFGNGAGAGVPGTLYYTAGPNGGSHGLVGSIKP